MRAEIISLNKKLVGTIEDVLRLNKLYIGQLDEVDKEYASKVIPKVRPKSKELKLVLGGNASSRLVYDIVSKSSKPIHVTTIVHLVKELCKKQNVKQPSDSRIKRSLIDLSKHGVINRVVRGLYSRKKSVNVVIPKMSKKDALTEVLENADAPLTYREICKILANKYDHDNRSNTISVYLYRWNSEGIVKRSEDGYILIKDKKVEKKVAVNKSKIESRSDAVLDIFSNSENPLLIREVMNILETDYPSVPRGGYDTTNKTLRRLLKRGLIQRLAPGVYSRV